MSKLKIIVLIVIIIFLGIGSLSIFGWYKYYSFGFKAGMLPIQFYGKVVDQHGVNVTNAKVPFCLSGALLASGKGCGATYTDADGRFSIKSEGGGLTLYMMTHPDIDFQFPKPNYGGLHPARTLEMNFYGYQRTKSRNDPLWTDSSIDKPYIFVAWRYSYNLAQAKNGEDNIYLNPNGEIYTLNFNKKGRFGQVRGITDGHLRITCKRDKLNNKKKRIKSLMTITPVNGGIQSTNDRYLNLAPVTGYQPSISIKKEILLNQQFYFKSNNGKEYGSLYVHFYPLIKPDKCRIDIAQYKINSSGSQNLEVKRK